MSTIVKELDRSYEVSYWVPKTDVQLAYSLAGGDATYNEDTIDREKYYKHLQDIHPHLSKADAASMLIQWLMQMRAYLVGRSKKEDLYVPYNELMGYTHEVV